MYHLVGERDNKEATTILYKTYYDGDTQGVMGTHKEERLLLRQGYPGGFAGRSNI